LGENFLVRRIHAGKPPATWTTAPVNLFLQLARRLRPALRTRAQEEGFSDEAGQIPSGGQGLASLLYAFRAVALAWDRRNLLLKSWRDAAKGEIVISDRYPSNITGAMDSPRLKEKTGRGGWVTSVYNRASRLEQRLYAQVPPPDIVIRLQVSVETAKERNRVRNKPGEETDRYIESRHRLAPQWQRTDTGRIFDVDTERSLAETLLAVKEHIWRAL
jgi:thymidylate kinase